MIAIELETNVVKNAELSTSESVAIERYQIEYPGSLKGIDSKQSRENDDTVDTDIEMDSNNEVENANEIKESPMNNEGLENAVVQYYENTEWRISESVARKITETPNKNVDIE